MHDYKKTNLNGNKTLCNVGITNVQRSHQWPENSYALVNLTEILALKRNRNLHFNILIFCFAQHPVICLLHNTKCIPSSFI